MIGADSFRELREIFHEVEAILEALPPKDPHRPEAQMLREDIFAAMRSERKLQGFHQQG